MLYYMYRKKVQKMSRTTDLIIEQQERGTYVTPKASTKFVNRKKCHYCQGTKRQTVSFTHTTITYTGCEACTEDTNLYTENRF